MKENFFFKWLLKLNPHDNNKLKVFARNEPEFKNLSLKDLKNNTYIAMCGQESSSCNEFTKLGFLDDQIIRLPHSYAGNFELMLLRKRADFFISYESTVFENLEVLGSPKDILLPLLELESKGVYLAAPKNIRSDLLERLVSKPE